MVKKYLRESSIKFCSILHSILKKRYLFRDILKTVSIIEVNLFEKKRDTLKFDILLETIQLSFKQKIKKRRDHKLGKYEIFFQQFFRFYLKLCIKSWFDRA